MVKRCLTISRMIIWKRAKYYSLARDRRQSCLEGLHWMRHVTFDENRYQVRIGASPQFMAVLCNVTTSLTRIAANPSVTAALNHHAAHPREALALSRDPSQ